MHTNHFAQERLKFKPAIPKVFKDLLKVHFVEKEREVTHDLEGYFPHIFGRKNLSCAINRVAKTAAQLRVGVVLSGGQAPGGHNVIAALFDALQIYHPNSQLIGFLDGPSGIIENRHLVLTEKLLASYRNTGGFDLIGSGRTKIETPEQFEKALNVVQTLSLDGLVVIGGDDSNTNAAFLAEYFLSKKCATKVIGVPKTIDGDLKGGEIEISFGFDTACKVYAEMVGNIAKDALSSKKYYHFVKLMGRSASHIALEVALQTRPNLTLIGEEVAAQKRTLQQIIGEMADLIEERAKAGKNYGVILIPEGLIEFIPEIKVLISEINAIMAKGTHSDVLPLLSVEAKATFSLIPESLQRELLIERDSHGNVQVSHIATEEFLLHAVKKELKKRVAYKGKFNPVKHFFGYEGRSAFPSNFDANYCYALGLCAAALIQNGFTGYMSAITHLTEAPSEWKAGGVALTSLMHIEERKGVKKPVIRKALVDLQGEAFAYFATRGDRWKLEDEYRFPGPMQFFGPASVSDALTYTLEIEHNVSVHV